MPGFVHALAWATENGKVHGLRLPEKPRRVLELTLKGSAARSIGRKDRSLRIGVQIRDVIDDHSRLIVASKVLRVTKVADSYRGQWWTARAALRERPDTDPPGA